MQKIYRKDKSKAKVMGYIQKLDRKGLESSLAQQQVVGLSREEHLFV